MDTLLQKVAPFIWLFYLRDTLGDHCTDEHVDQCWAPVDSYLEFQGYDPDHSEFTYSDLSEAELRDYCSIYQGQSRPCLTDVVEHCSSEFKKEFEGLDDSQDFFCNEGLEAYIKHKDCIDSSTVQTKVQQCNSQLEQELDYIFSQYLASSELTDRACKAFHDSIVCDKEATEDICGVEAGEWMETYEKKLYGPQVDHYGCDLESYAGNYGNDVKSNSGNENSGNSNSNWINYNGRDKFVIIVGALLGGLVVLILVSLAGCYCGNKRRFYRAVHKPGQPSVTVAYINQPGLSKTQPQEANVLPTFLADKTDVPPPFYEQPDKADLPPSYYEQPLPSKY